MEKAPDWHSERFFETTIKPQIDEKGYAIVHCGVVKETMIATINYFRTKKQMKCEWIEEEPNKKYLIKVYPKETNALTDAADQIAR